MATSIQSTALDFNNIKENLKTFLKKQEEFKDYDFEAAGLSNILDVLAYNTHINGLIANFTTNESFLNTAQLRSSIVSLATGIGYIPDSRASSRAFVNITVDLTAVADAPAVIELPRFTRLSATVDDITYTFQTLETFTASNDNGIFEFKTAEGSTSIPVFEGSQKTKTFRVADFNEADVYIIPDANLDLSTVEVLVFETASSVASVPYTSITKATSVNENSTIYILKEAPNGFYQLSFGNNNILGQAPTAGNKITVSYLSTNGPAADLAGAFSPVDDVAIGGVDYPLIISTVTRSAGGKEKESVESIRTNAPFQYASQNRMVTADDYRSIILQNFRSLIKDIKTFGGQDAVAPIGPKFGTVFTSILFEDDVSTELQASTKTSIINLVNQLAVLSFNVEFIDPEETFIEFNCFFQVNPDLTPLSLNALRTSVQSTISTYFTNTIGGFDQSFRRSNVLTLVDDVNPGILSSRADVRIQRRFTPIIGGAKNTQILSYPVALASPSNTDIIVRSSNFTLNNKTCRIQNKLSSNTLQVVDIGTGDIIIDSVGSYDPIGQTVSIVGLTVDQVLGNVSFLKISVTPANQSAVSPERNELLKYDPDASLVRAVLTTADN